MRRAWGVDARLYASRHAARASPLSHDDSRCAATASSGRPVLASRTAFAKNSRIAFLGMSALGNILPN